MQITVRPRALDDPVGLRWRRWGRDVGSDDVDDGGAVCRGAYLRAAGIHVRRLPLGVGRRFKNLDLGIAAAKVDFHGFDVEGRRRREPRAAGGGSRESRRRESSKSWVRRLRGGQGTRGAQGSFATNSRRLTGRPCRGPEGFRHVSTIYLSYFCFI